MHFMQDWQKAGNFLTLFWPYVGLALGYGLLLPLISSSTAKLNDQATLAWLQMPVYALHQVCDPCPGGIAASAAQLAGHLYGPP